MDYCVRLWQAGEVEITEDVQTLTFDKHCEISCERGQILACDTLQSGKSIVMGSQTQLLSWDF